MKKVLFLCFAVLLSQEFCAQQSSNEYIQRFLTLRNKINDLPMVILM
jgi:hypothetical protein